MQIKGHRFIVLIFLAITVSNNGFSQPFSNLEIGINMAQPFGLESEYTSRWDYSNSYGLQFTLPYYFGEVSIAYNKFDYLAKNDGFDIETSHYSVWLGKEIKLYKNFFSNIAFGVGIYRTHIPDPKFDYNPTERELSFNAQTEILYRINSISIYTSASYNKVFNYYRQQNLLVGLGLKYTIPLNSTISKFIK